MPVKDSVLFAHDEEGKLFYRDVRPMIEDDRIRALKRRLDSWLVRQIDELGKEEGGEAKVYSPFPLALLTCVAMETLGMVMYYDDSKKDDNAQIVFRIIAKKIDQKFGRPLPKTFKNALSIMLGKKDAEKVKSPSDLLYRFFRNTLIHNYQGLVVYITEGTEFELTTDGTMELNPYWMWRCFKATYDELFDELFSNKEPTNARRKSALQYVDRLVE